MKSFLKAFKCVQINTRDSGFTLGTFEKFDVNRKHSFQNIKRNYISDLQAHEFLRNENVIANNGTSEYAKKVLIPVTATATGAQTDYIMPIKLVKSTGDNIAGTIYLNDECLNWPYDIRFVDDDGALMSYFRGLYDDTSGIWYVLIPSVPAEGDINIYLYYGSNGVVDGSSLDDIQPDFYYTYHNKFYDYSGFEGIINPIYLTAAGVSNSLVITGSPDYRFGTVNYQMDITDDVIVSNVSNYYESWPCAAVDTNGICYVAYSTKSLGDANYQAGRKIVMRASTDNTARAYGAESDIVSVADDARYANICTFVDANSAENLMCVYTVMDSGGAFQTYVKTTPTASISWSAAVQVSSNVADRSSYGKPIQITSSGSYRILVPLYQTNVVANTSSVFINYSDDYGATWDEVELELNDDATQLLAEPILFEVGGIIYCYARNASTAFDPLYAQSEDEGETWTDWAACTSIPHNDASASVLGSPTTTIDGSILIPISYNYKLMAMRSTDGVNWLQAGYLYYPPAGTTTEHWPSMITLVDGTLGLIRQDQTTYPDIYFHDYPSVSNWDRCLELHQGTTGTTYLRHPSSIPINTAGHSVEACARMTAANTSSGAVQFGLVYSNTNSNIRITEIGSNYGLACRKHSPVGATAHTTGIARDDNYHIYSIRVTSNRASLYVDNTQVETTITTNVPSSMGGMYVFMGTLNATDTVTETLGHFSWILNRNIVYPEPTWATPGEQSTGGDLDESNLT